MGQSQTLRMSDKNDYYSIEDAKKSLTSKLHRFELLSEEDSRGSSIFAHLSSVMPEIDPESWPERAAFGGVYFNGRRSETDKALSYPCKIEYYKPDYELSDAGNYYPEISESDIIFRQQGLIAVFKPSGLPSMPAKDQKFFNLRDQLKQILGTDSDIHFPSRIDTSVSGLLLLSESRKLHNKLQDLYAKQKIHKEYLALVNPCPDWQEVEIDQPIARHKSWGVLREINPESGKKSITLVKKAIPACSTEGSCLLIASPKTGRTHQIRLHLAFSGCPIVGDRFYGGLKNKDLHLMSNLVSFEHPIDRNKISIELPDSFKPEWALQAVV